MTERENKVGLNTLIPPFPIFKWIEENKAKLQPPVGAELIFQEAQYSIMVVGGPNRRSDYHVNETEEFFYQLKGDMLLKVVWDGKFQDVPIKEGEIFLLPGNTPHSPQRFADTAGLVIELRRQPEHIDKLRWYCDNCKEQIYEESFHVYPSINLGKLLTPIINKFYGDKVHRTCKKCGHVSEPPAPHN